MYSTTGGGMGWAERMGRNQGWDLVNLARGGTGYISSVKDPEKAKTACGLDACPNFPGMINDAKALSPDIVIVAGGRNDAPVNPPVKAAAILKFYQDLRAALPKATIVAIGAFWDSTPAPATLAEVTADVKESAESVGGTFVDVGHTLSGHPENVAPDGVHPTNLGHAAIFEAAVARLQTAGIAV